MPNKDMEKRSYNLKLEVRADGDEGKKLKGHAAVFDEVALIGGERWGFDETIKRKAFTESIKEDDVRALFNHDANFVLGRNTAGTLEMKEDKDGLAVTIDPPDTQLIRDMVIAPIERGDVSQMSFAFRVLEDKWTFSEDEKVRDKREIIKVKLFDVSPVTYPAYEGTDVALASRDKSLNHKREQNKTNRNCSTEKRRLDIKRKELSQ